MLTIFETLHWIVTHRKDSRYPGFLIVATKSTALEISALDAQALTELGPVLAKAEKLLLSFYNPHRVITAKLGFSAGHACHFHMLPVTLDFLKEIVDHPNYADDPDGNDALLYASREYGERPLNDLQLTQQLETVKELTAHLIQIGS